MPTTILPSRLKDILKQLKAQFISISISNASGKWSDQYYSILEIKEFRSGHESILVVVLSAENDECVVLDARLIGGIRCNKYLNLEGVLTEEVTVEADKLELSLTH